MGEEPNSVALVAVAKPEDEAGESKYEESLELLSIFADRVATLDAAAWERINQRCAALDGPSLEAMIERAALAASESVLGVFEPRSTVGAVLANSARVARAAFALGSEIVGEFEQPSTPDEPRVTGYALLDTRLRADWAIDSAVHRHAPGHRGVAAAMSGAKHAWLFEYMLSEAQFGQLYGFVEPEIPFASVRAERTARRVLRGHAAADAERLARRRRVVDRFVRFVDRLEALSPDAWARIDDRCARLNNASFDALTARVAFRARLARAWTRGTEQRAARWGGAPNLFDVIMAAWLFADEVRSEFGAPERDRRSATHRVARLDPEWARSVDAFERMRSIVRAHARHHRGTELVITSAAMAIQWPPGQTAEEIAELYAPIEPEIPMAELER